MHTAKHTKTEGPRNTRKEKGFGRLQARMRVRLDVRIAHDAVDAIVAHAREAAPAECCGLLLGSPASIVEAARTRNIATDSTSRFLIDPKDHIDGRREARRRSLEVVGFYHSHPRSPAVPSARDRAE